MRVALIALATALILAVLLGMGWYLSRIYATSAFEEEPWLQDPDSQLPIVYKPVDKETMRKLRPIVDQAVLDIEAFFDAPFPTSLSFYILPDRAALDAHWRAAFDMQWFISTCWMVGSGQAAQLSVLSPREWAKEDCGHDPEDPEEIRKLLAHELTHAFHDQVNPSADIGAFESIGWFIEGLAVHVSGQLEGDQLAGPAEAISSGKAPAHLEETWSGKYRYGVSGSMVEFIDASQGRKALLELMHYTTETEILSALGMTEDEFLNKWQRYVLEGPQ